MLYLFGVGVFAIIGRQFLLVVIVDCLLDATCAAVAYFDCVAVEYFPERVLVGKTLVYQAIDNHNKQKLAAYNGENTNPEEANAKLCNCRKKDSCPLNGECLQPAVIYQAKVTRSDNSQSETNVGLTESEFKTRYHTNSFRNAKSKNSTELSKYIWHLKENKIDYDITWSVIGHAKPYNSANKRCNLCLSEKYVIIYEPHRCTLNKRNELVLACRHRNKMLQRNN